MHQLPAIIDSGNQGKFHVQGICLDRERQTIYYSFTTSLVKSDLSGRVIGSVRGLTGHLGCIAMGPDGKVYGSLEYKNDAIGQGILARMGRGGESHRDGFYVAVFDVDRIDRLDMDAEADGIMQAVYLNKVVEDYHAQVVNAGKPRLHRHGCSGIDGITFARAAVPVTPFPFMWPMAYTAIWTEPITTTRCCCAMIRPVGIRSFSR